MTGFRPVRTEPAWVRRLLVGSALVAVAILLVLPLALVFAEALRDGLPAYVAALAEPDARAALRLTAVTLAVVLPVNVVAGVAAGWALGKFDFPGRSLVVSLIDLPFAVSPVVAGMLFVLLFGRTGLFRGAAEAAGLQVLFAPPAIVLATLFVTFPFVARELIPTMQSLGTDEEEAAHVLGAGFFQILRRVSLPNALWGLLYGVLLCAARAAGEFGAVSVVSGHIRGQTNTLPLEVEILYNEYRYSAAFAVASLLTGLALVTIALKAFLEARERRGGSAR
ncbi:MAG TPA: sulfate ABC transporter permease subunit CysW [Thermoanaerobaculia bacterium]|nr:sulfate ABC transporter permease subunit CysW [Thermoanaerobaculia bacterium]HQR68727.1 sulfate ABC transporter permease subunit CysW [Thermoanaerobaculia bacterium]